MSINQRSLSQLTGLGFSNQTIQRIINNNVLVSQINEFQRNGGDFLPTPQGQISAFAKAGNIYFTPNSQYATFSVLSHELGHALGDQQSTNRPSDYSTAKAYANSRGNGEAEAIYNEYEVIKGEIASMGGTAMRHHYN